jgi:hypothetical protein
MSNDMQELIDNALSSGISRVVAAIVPVLSGVLAAGLLWLQNAVGIDLQVDPAVAAAFVGTIVLGGCLVGLKWLEGRAQFEKIAAELAAAYQAGQTHIDQAGPPVPPGVQ